MRIRKVPSNIQIKVIKWFDYLWLSQKSSDEEKSINCLPGMHLSYFPSKIIIQLLTLQKGHNFNNIMQILTAKSLLYITNIIILKYILFVIKITCFSSKTKFTFSCFICNFLKQGPVNIDLHYITLGILLPQLFIFVLYSIMQRDLLCLMNYQMVFTQTT